MTEDSFAYFSSRRKEGYKIKKGAEPRSFNEKYKLLSNQ